MSNKDDTSLIRNASILMVAALVSKIIGMLYKSPLSSTLGSESMACFNFAQNVYMILLMISSFSIPQAVSKIMAEKLAFKRYRDAQTVFKAALLYAVVMGGAAALVCVYGVNILVPENMANARLALQFLAPTIFLSGILGVFRGYFQAFKNMVPTSISQIIEQIFVAVVAITASGLMVRIFSGGTEDELQSWSAAGATIGTGAGVLAALLFMLYVYYINSGKIQKKIQADRVSLNESYGDVMRTLLLIMTPIILSSFIYNVNGYINSYMYTDILGRRDCDTSILKVMYAEYGYFMTLINIPLTLAGTAPMSMIPEVSGMYAKKNIPGANDKTRQATWISMIISIPSAVGLMILGTEAIQVVFPVSNGMGGSLMFVGACMIVLNSNSNISNGVLQGIGKPRIPMINAAISLVADIVALFFMLWFTQLGIYSVVIAMILYSIMICWLNDRAMKKYLGFRNPWRYAYVEPMLACIPMGLVCGGLNYAMKTYLPPTLLGSYTVATLFRLMVCVGLAVIVYFIAYLAISKPTEEDMRNVPGGSLIVKFGRKLHLC